MPKQRKSRNTGTVYERSAGRHLAQSQVQIPQMNYFDAQRYVSWWHLTLMPSSSVRGYGDSPCGPWKVAFGRVIPWYGNFSMGKLANICWNNLASVSLKVRSVGGSLIGINHSIIYSPLDHVTRDTRPGVTWHKQTRSLFDLKLVWSFFTQKR